MKLIAQVAHDLVQNIIVTIAVAAFIVGVLFFWKQGTIKWPLYDVKQPKTINRPPQDSPQEPDQVVRINDYWYGGQYIPGYSMST
jgi:hypothetical protein